ncbi:hypothetical protein Srufu_004220 [Streptomyces libani subsp. rufus]|nr:hypothetical protein Srufu_004220 [Streptomyces libani subsp. rufus]
MFSGDDPKSADLRAKESCVGFRADRRAAPWSPERCDSPERARFGPPPNAAVLTAAAFEVAGCVDEPVLSYRDGEYTRSERRGDGAENESPHVMSSRGSIPM